MTWTVTFFSDRVEAELLVLSAGFVARFIRYAERTEVFSPDLGMGPYASYGRGAVRTQDQSRRRGFAGLLLHGSKPSNRRASSLRKENRQNPIQGLEVGRRRLKEVKDA